MLENSHKEPEIHSIESFDAEDVEGQSIDDDTTSSMSSASDINNYTCFDL